MKLNQEAYRIRKMVSLIEAQNTGSPTALSEELGISRSCLYELIDQLKALNVEIKFNRGKNTFSFVGNKRIVVREPVLIIDKEELINTNAGFVKTTFPYFFLDGATLI